ncbi:MAG: peptide ABC transporter substrate-binding protein [Caldilineaceae bacterium]
MSYPSKVSRRTFLQLAGASAGMAAVAACTAPAATGPAAGESAPVAASTGPVVNSLGVELPADAAPLEYQTVYIQGGNSISISADWFKVNYRQLPGTWLGGEPLAILDKDMMLLPGAAESWEVMDDKVTWHFHLRPEMEWSDGTPLTAHDWVNSFRYGADPATGFDFAWYFFFMKNWTAVNAGELPVEELGCRAVDDYTLEVVTEYPAPYVPGWLAICVPHPKHAFDEHGEAWSLQPETYVASGPFKLAQLVPDGETVWEINTNYKGPIKPLVERIVYVPGTQPLGGSPESPQVTLASYLGGEYYHTGPWSVPNLSDLQRARQEVPDELHSYPHFQTYYVGMNTFQAPFDNLKVRQAFSHAIDRETLTNTVLRDQGQPAYTMVMNGFPGEHVDELKDVQKYDPELAKQLLAEAGYPDGDGFPALEMWIRGPDRPEAAEAVATMLAQNLNIQVSVVQAEVKTFMDTLNAKDLLFYWVPYQFDFVDASNFLSIWRSDGRHAWQNETFEELLRQADSEFDDATKRDDLFLQAERTLVEDCPAVFVFHPTFWQLWKPFMSGEDLTPNQAGFAAWVYLNNRIFRTWYINNSFTPA